MNFIICEKRHRFLEREGHALVLGGPGSGKTTLALLKARRFLQVMKPGQKALFLSFSRAAVQQILLRCKDVLQREERDRIAIGTYHAFCWDVLRSHGRALRGVPLRMLNPGEESRARARYEGDWEAERRRLSDAEGIVCFDLFAAGAARLLEESRHLRGWLGALHPIVIVDEFQDTDDEQWRLVQALAQTTTVVFLADPEQRIYDWRPGVRPDRLEILRQSIDLSETDLEEDNHRSRNTGIIGFANAVLRGAGPLPRTADVRIRTYQRVWNMFEATVHASVAHTLGELRRRDVEDPSLAVLTPTNVLVADISDLLGRSHGFGGRQYGPIAHDVVWDAELSASAALVVAATLEMASAPSGENRVRLMERIGDYFLAKQGWTQQHAGRGAQSAGQRTQRFARAAERLRRGTALGRGAPQALSDAITALDALRGDPVSDWRAVRTAFGCHNDLHEILNQARMVRLFGATDALATTLTELWISNGTYEGATSSVRRVLDQERLIGAERPPQGCVVMTLHKSKGKEFDGVIIVEGFRSGALLREREAPQYEPSRRLLRVGITRARSYVMIVRPENATPLAG